MMAVEKRSAVGDKAREAEGKAKEIWLQIEIFFINLWNWSLKHKEIAIPAAVGILLVLVLFFSCCCYCCCCRKKTRKKIKEKLKMKGVKPSKMLRRIQPGKRVKRVMEEVGSMTFRLKYNQSTEILTVKVIESNDIPVRDLSGHSYSFVEVKLLPLHKDSPVEYKTALVRPATFNPSFGDGFTFCIPQKEAKQQKLCLTQYEKNRFSQKDGIGQIEMDLKSVLTTKEEEYIKKLYPYDPLIGVEKETGAVYLSMELDRDIWELKIEIEEADILPEDEDKEKCTSYVTLGFVDKEGKRLEKRKTNTCPGTLQPEFDEVITFSVPDGSLLDTQILIKLKSKRFLLPSKLIGQFIITHESESWKKLLEDNALKARWFQMYHKPSS